MTSHSRHTDPEPQSHHAVHCRIPTSRDISNSRHTDPESQSHHAVRCRISWSRNISNSHHTDLEPQSHHAVRCHTPTSRNISNSHYTDLEPQSHHTGHCRAPASRNISHSHRAVPVLQFHHTLQAGSSGTHGPSAGAQVESWPARAIVHCHFSIVWQDARLALWRRSRFRFISIAVDQKLRRLVKRICSKK